MNINDMLNAVRTRYPGLTFRAQTTGPGWLAEITVPSYEGRGMHETLEGAVHEAFTGITSRLPDGALVRHLAIQ